MPDAGEHLDFLGYTFRYKRDQFGHAKRFLSREPKVNEQVNGWANYFDKDH